jgi:uncharacterized protein (TIGR00299 family) protein
MKILYIDLIAGVSGDMLLGALIDAGLNLETLSEMLSNLKIDEFDLTSRSVEKNGFKATKVDVRVDEQPPERHLNEILDVIRSSSLPLEIQNQAIRIFQNIATVEAGIHGKPIDQIHLHELGGTDTIVDVAGVLLGLDHLGIDQVYSSSIPLGNGFITGAHGQIPLPAPATLGLLKGKPVRQTDIQAELTTPTGAALLADLVDQFTPPPEMDISSIGYGAGSRDLQIPNLLRVVIGETGSSSSLIQEKLALLSTNLDDLNPEIYPYVMDQLFAAGALDVCLLPIQMKKGRPGTQIQVLSDLQKSTQLKDILFRETSTLGIRQTIVDRFCLPRTSQEVETSFGKIRVKVAETGTQTKVSPEFEDCQRIALEKKLPLQEVYQEAIQSYYSKKINP